MEGTNVHVSGGKSRMNGDGEAVSVLIGLLNLGQRMDHLQTSDLGANFRPGVYNLYISMDGLASN